MGCAADLYRGGVPPIIEQDLTRSMTTSVFVTMFGGVLLFAAWFVDMPVLAVGWVIFVGGLVALAVLTHREARRSGLSFWQAARRAGRRFLRGAVDLMP